MTDPGCRSWRDELTDVALGRQVAAEVPGLRAHLDGCPSCRAELEGLSSIAAALAEADADAALPAAPRDLASRVNERLKAEQRDRRRRRWSVAATAAAAALLVALGLTLALRSDSDTGTTASDRADLSVVLDGADASGTADFVIRGWGTEIVLVAEGLVAGDTYQAWLSPGEDTRVSAGTFVGTESGRLEITLASSLPLADATWIWVTDADDETVLAASF